MQLPTTTKIVLAALASLAACRSDGACRPAPPDPEPAETVPVGADDPNKPVEQPAKPDDSPPPT